jgi:hypothetical protein
MRLAAGGAPVTERRSTNAIISLYIQVKGKVFPLQALEALRVVRG